MSWKSTIVLAGLAACTFAAWFLLQPEAESEEARARPFEWRENLFHSITIRREGQTEIVLRRQKEAVQGSLWHLEKPAKPVDDSRVAEMIAALRRLSRDRAIKPGHAEHTPSTYGLDRPAVIVEISAAGDRRAVKFGNPSTRHPDYRFFMIEGEPEIFYGPVDTASPFQRTAEDLRSRVILTYDAGRVVGAEVSRKFIRAGSDGKPGLKPEYEKLKFEFRSSAGGGRKGWYLIGINDEPRDEPAEDSKLGHLISGFKELRAEEYAPLDAGKNLGFDEPELVIRFDVLQPPSSATQPIIVEVGKTENRAARKVTYVRVDKGDEAAVVSAASVDRLPRERKQFLSADLIDFEPNLLEEVEMLTETGHRVKLVKKETEETRGEEKFKSVQWLVKEPAGLPAEPSAVNDFVSLLVRITVKDFLGEQPDLSAFGLDKPGLTLTMRIRPKSGEMQDRVYKFGRPGNTVDGDGYLLKHGSKEVYQVSDDIWRRLDRSDLNFRKLELFNISSDAIVGVSFTYQKDHLSANPVRYSVRKGEGGKWEFDDPDLRRQGLKVDPDRMTTLLSALNFVRAEGFLTRNPRIAREYKLDGNDPPGRLVIRHADPANPGKSTEKVLRLSMSYASPSGPARFYYAKFEPAPGDASPSSDATIIFRIKTDHVEALRQGVVHETKAQPDSSQEKK